MATEEKRIQRIIDNVGNIQDGQICIEPSADGDIGGERLGWKDSHGTTHKALAKDEAARVTTLTATSDVDWPTKANLFNMTSNDTDDLTEGSTNLFLTPTVIADIDALEQYNSDRADATLEFSGFTNNENISVSYNISTRTVTLAGTFKMYYKGVEVLDISTSWESPAHAASPTTAMFLLYDGSFSWSTTPFTPGDVPISIAEYDASSNFLLCQREVHGFMPWPTRNRLHTAIGTTRESGGDFGGYTLASTTAADRRPTMSECVILDEDLVSTLTAHTSGDNYSYLYLSGASGTPVITVGSADIVGLSGAIPYWNQFTGGAWQQTAMVNNSFMNLWVAAIPTTSDSDSVRNRFLFFAGQTNPTTSAAASSESVNSLNLGLFSGLSPEYIFIQKITLRYTGGNWSWYATERLEGTKTSQTASVSGSWLSSVSSDTTLDGNGTASNPLGVSASITSTINQLDETRLGPNDVIAFTSETSAPASILSANSWPVSDLSGLTSTFTIPGYSLQTVTYPASTTTAAQVISAINSQASGVTAESDGSGNVRVYTDAEDYTQKIIAGGTASTVFWIWEAYGEGIPAGTPTEGDRYIFRVDGATHEGQFTEYRNSTWNYYTPNNASRVYSLFDRFTYVWQDNDWKATIDWVLKATTNDGAGTGDTAIMSFDGATDYPQMDYQAASALGLPTEYGVAWYLRIDVSVAQTVDSPGGSGESNGAWEFKGLFIPWRDAIPAASQINGTDSGSFPVDLTALYTAYTVFDTPSVEIDTTTKELKLNVGHTSSNSGDYKWVANVTGFVVGKVPGYVIPPA